MILSGVFSIIKSTNAIVLQTCINVFAHTYLALCFIVFNFRSSWLGENIRTRTDYGQFLTSTFNYNKPLSITDQPQTSTSNTNGGPYKGRIFDNEIVDFKLKKIAIYFIKL